MKIFDIFSKRQKRIQGEIPDVYQYETIPHELRVQIVHIWRDLFWYSPLAFEIYQAIYDTLCREYGVFSLGNNYDEETVEESICNFLLETEETEKAIDVIELLFQYIDGYVRDNNHKFRDQKISPDAAIAELNHRFREHGVGYQYESGQIIRVDSQIIHSEVVQPALNMLSDPMYEGANAEFLSAHEHYRNRRYKECLNDCLKSFESCLKAICDNRKWAYNKRDTANRLIEILFAQGLIPNFMQSHFSALRSTLEAGVPTIRNQLSAHGQGSKEVPVLEYIARYALHLTASNILVLASADKKMK